MEMDILRLKTKFYERFSRTAAKTITWRAMMMVTNSTIGWWVTGDIVKGLKVGLLALVINSTLYVFHERFWNRSDWAKEKNTKEGVKTL